MRLDGLNDKDRASRRKVRCQKEKEDGQRCDVGDKQFRGFCLVRRPIPFTDVNWGKLPFPSNNFFLLSKQASNKHQHLRFLFIIENGRGTWVHTPNMMFLKISVYLLSLPMLL